MPALENNGGDVLARGAARAQFKPAGSKMTKEAWDAIFADYDPAAYRDKPNPATQEGQGIKANSSGGIDEKE